MILTGAEIETEVTAGVIIIDNFDPERLEPNSYGFRLSDTILTYDMPVGAALDCHKPPSIRSQTIGPEGLTLCPGQFYLASTMEAMGSPRHAAELYAARSVSTLGIWIQFSAPLGHSGAIFPWTLEIMVAQPVRVYAGMVIGKIAFWTMQGKPVEYVGKYTGSRAVVASRFSLDQVPS